MGAGSLTVSLALFRMERRSRLRDIVDSIEDLGRLLDYHGDVTGSTAVAWNLVRRLEALSAALGVTVPVTGTARFQAGHDGQETYQLLIGSFRSHGSTWSSGPGLEVREGTVIQAGPAASEAGWRGTDFMLLRAGLPISAPRADVRTLQQRSRDHSLTVVRPGAEVVYDEESSSVRAARVRQTSRAGRIVKLAVAGEAAAARTEYRAALAQPGADGPLIDSLTSRITSLHEYWLVDDVLGGAGQANAGDALPETATSWQLRDRLGARLDHLLGLLPQASAQTPEQFLPMVTPIIYELGDALVPLADSRQDGGRFLYELIPAMKHRIFADTGVRVPGVRARGTVSLSAHEYEIQVDEVPVLSGFVTPDARYVVERVGREAPDRYAEPTSVHPLTGARGSWLLYPAGHDDGTEGEHVTAAEYLIHRLDMVLRTHLVHYLGAQAVDGLVEGWTKEDDDGLVGSVLTDKAAVLKLTWVLQALVADGVPITDWQSVLRALRDAGGMTAPTRTLCRAARKGLRHRLVAARAGRRSVRVPARHEAVLLGRPTPHAAVERGAARIRFLHWLRQAVELDGPTLSLVTGSQDARELIAPLVHAEYPFVMTCSEEELTPDGT
ncbi:FHIPEP family type III secretion protein [Streptomyces melanogenes]|uniref:FHIPEP family type III secretion protein n=1 Tax=Streptomyces melanogenes TaxID=67326 RepID=UPI00167C814D|nr:FHIPEP family type III secretion protein [Streptomyces melanogenes]